MRHSLYRSKLQQGKNIRNAPEINKKILITARKNEFFPRIQNIITSDLKFKLIISRCSCPEVFCKKGVLRNLAKFTSQENTCARVSFLINLQADFIKKQTLTQVFFPLNLVKFLRTPFITEYFRWLLLNIQM